MWVFPIFGFPVNPLYSRTSDGIDMKLEPVTKLGKRNKTSSKKLTMASFQKTMTLLLFYQFMANLEQSVSGIPDA